jgi:hypothetical protein
MDGFMLTIEIGSWWLGISSNLLTKKTPTKNNTFLVHLL